MTSLAIDQQPIPLDPITLGSMRCTTTDALPHHPQASAEEITNQHNAAFLVVAALRPRDPLEAMLAARIVAAHFHTMDNFRCAAQRDLPPDLQLRFQGRAVTLSRMMDLTLHNFMDRQTVAPRRPAVTVPVAAPAPQPAPEAARTVPPPAPVKAATAQQVAPPSRQAVPAPTATPVPSPASSQATTGTQTSTAIQAPGPLRANAAHPAPSGTASHNAATLERLMAEVAARAAAASTALVGSPKEAAHAP
jgi:hypothetical protein